MSQVSQVSQMSQMSQPLKIAQISFIFYLQPAPRPQPQIRKSQAMSNEPVGTGLVPVLLPFPSSAIFSSLHTSREHGIIHSTSWHHTLIKCLPVCLSISIPVGAVIFL